MKYIYKLFSITLLGVLLADCGSDKKTDQGTPAATETEEETPAQSGQSDQSEESGQNEDTVQVKVPDYDVEAVLNRYADEKAMHNDMGGNHSDKKVIYLTFDDGPSPLTAKILNILKENGVHATFFVTGHHSGCLHYIRRAYEEGNAIAAHTASHQYSIYTSLDTYFNDLEAVEKVIEEQTGSRTSIIRFPGGSSNHAFYRYAQDSLFMIRLTQEVRDRGYQYVDWNLSSQDATGCKVPVSTLLRYSCRAGRNDLCLLMHDTYGKETTVEALPAIIQFFKENGYEFGTLTDPSYVCHHAIKPYSDKQKGAKCDSTRVTTPRPNNTRRDAPASALSAPAVATPSQHVPVEAKPTEAKPVETQSAETKPTEQSPAETKSTETKPTETKSAENEPVSQSSDNS